MIRWLLLMLACITTSWALGHDARPIYVEVAAVGNAVEGGGQRYETKLKVPDAISVVNLPSLKLPVDCQLTKPGFTRQEIGSAIVERDFLCELPMAGRKIEMAFGGVNPSLSTVVRVTLPEDVVYSTILPPGEYAWQIPEEASALTVAYQYIWLGVKHIWLGIDHLLFVLCLLFVAQTWRRILVTITGFTIAHSLTLVLSVLDWVYLPIPVVEAIIALSIVFLALEILQDDRSSWTYQYPVSVAASFGLLHGFGFASVLRELGLPQTELPTALVSFNVGVELGQIAFIAVVLLAAQFVRLDISRWRVACCYGIGAVASFWLIDRTSGFWF